MDLVRRQLENRWAMAKMTRALLFGFLVVVVVGLIVTTTGIEAGELTRDPAAIIEFPFWIGAMSNLGAVVWVTGIAIAIFTALTTDGWPSPTRLLLVSGLYAAAVAFDDFFLFHEQVAPEILGFPEKWVAPVFLLVAMLIVLRYWRTILTTFWPPGLLAAGGFGLSVLVDITFKERYFFEDAPKFVGIVMATTYLVILAYDVKTGRLPLTAADQSPSQRPRAEVVSDTTRSAPRHFSERGDG